MKLPLSKKQKFALIVVASIVISFGITGLVYYLTEDRPITHYNFFGNELAFRDDLRLAQNISVSPDEETVLNSIWDAEIMSVAIAFMDTPDNELVAVNAFEIAYKLRIAYLTFDWDVPVNGMQIESFENLTGSKENLVVAMMPPSVTDETGVEMANGVVYIKGKTIEDFDRAVIKFLMASMNITV